MASKVQLYQLSQDVIDFILHNAGTGGGGGGALTWDIISNVAVGAAPAGTLFAKDDDLTSFAEKILLKDITPSISTSFTDAGVKEKGTVVNGTTITLKITNLSACTVPINTINFYDGGTLLNSVPFKEGQDTYTYTAPVIISTDKTFKAELVYGGNKKVFGTGIFTFVYASYYGTTNLAAIGDDDATALTSTFAKTIKANKALTWDNIKLNDERFCYMYPVSLGQLTSIKDGNGFDQMDSYTRTTVNLTAPTDHKVVPYYVYLLTDAATGTNFTQIYQ